MGAVDGQVEAHPGFALALEASDVARAERCRLRAGVEFRFHFQIEVGNADVFVQTVDRFSAATPMAGRISTQSSRRWALTLMEPEI